MSLLLLWRHYQTTHQRLVSITSSSTVGIQKTIAKLVSVIITPIVGFLRKGFAFITKFPGLQDGAKKLYTRILELNQLVSQRGRIRLKHPDDKLVEKKKRITLRPPNKKKV